MVSLMREVLHDDGLDAIFSRHVAPTTAEVLFSKALNRSIVGTMNDLVYNAKIMLSDGLTAPYDVGFRLNEMPSPAQGCADPRKAFLAQRSIDRSTEESRQG